MKVREKLIDWENQFSKELQNIEVSKRQKAGALLPVIPRRIEWDEFLKAVSTNWLSWLKDLAQYPSCLVVLYGGLAFYEYDEGRFWQPFAKAIGIDSIPPNRQTDINRAFAKVARQFGFPIHQKTETSIIHSQLGVELLPEDTPTSYVGSAIYHIGIPLSLWDGFLEICKWAGWGDDWTSLSDDEWCISVGKRTRGHTRLKQFLINNRETASFFIKEMLELRDWLSEDIKYTIADSAQASVLRDEYFDEVPETAEFLRPTNPESLIRNRAQLIWDERRGRIGIYLPGVHESKLPATWGLGLLEQAAATSPTELVLNSLAFQPALALQLVSAGETDSQRLRGVHPWGLFDLDASGRLVNPGREQLPLHSYTLVSHAPIASITREGFDETDCPANQRFNLTDDTQCFVTHLWPSKQFAELTLGDRDQQTKIQFRTNSKIEARFFTGRGHQAANFERLPHNILKIERLPVLCLAIPSGYFRDIYSTLKKKIRVGCDGKTAGGSWEPLSEFPEESEKEYYIWSWGHKPFLDLKHGTAKSLKELSQFAYSPDLRGERVFSVESPEFNVRYKVFLEHQRTGIDDCWKNLPGAFLPWFLVCQEEEGLTWDDLQLAREIIAPKDHLSFPLLRKYEKEGLLIQKGRRWMIAESRATIIEIGEGDFLLQYCGNPSILWGLYRKMHSHRQQLPEIEVINKRGQLPYLQMIWDKTAEREVNRYLSEKSIQIRPTLWNP